MIIYLKLIVVVAVIAIGVGAIDKVADMCYGFPFDKTYLYIIIMVFVIGAIIVSASAFALWLFSPELTAALKVQ